MELKTAKNIVIEICHLLNPHCEKINIAGSVRRLKPDVKDLEVICIPKTEVLKDMFGWDEGIIRSTVFCKTVYGLGTVLKGSAEGKYVQIELPEKINLDLFIPDDFDYYRQYAIRTGSAEYSARVIAGAWRKLGWCGSDKGLRRISDCVEIKTPDGRSKWKCIKPGAKLPPVWKSEEEFFEWAGIKYVRPSERNV